MSEPTTSASAADFHAASSRGRPLSLADFEGKLPMALVFLGPLDPESPELVDLDRHHVDFGRRRVQLLVVAEANGPDVRAVPWSGLDLPVLADPHREITGRFAETDGPSDGFYALVDPATTIVERGPFTGVPALLERVDANRGRLH